MRATTDSRSWFTRRGFTRYAGLAAAALLVTACGQTMAPTPSFGPAAAPPQPESLGSGSTTVALLLPMSASGNAGRTANAMRNAAELAVSEVQGGDVRIVPVDSRGTSEGAEAAARTAVDQGAEMIVGPLFASEVRGASGVARPAGVPMIAFSSDANVASQGVYLLSFLPEGDIDRIISYATREGKRSFAAILPEGSYGSVVEAAFQQSVSRNNGRVAAIARYGEGREEMQAAVQRIADVAGGESPQADALLIPDSPSALAELAPMLTAAGVSPRRVQFLGSGQWNDEAAWRIDALDGGWFAAPDPGPWQNFRNRFQSRFGDAPPRNATLAYDAVTLAAALSRLAGPNGYSNSTLTNPDGFAGVDGVFRFRGNGTNERGLAILELRDGQARPRDSAPRALAAGS